MKAAPRISDFTNDNARQRFQTVYQGAMTRLWPAPFTTITVPTTYGEAVAYRTGPAEGTPVVLVPGAGGSAVTWYHYVARLARHHPVIGLDPVGEPSASRQTRPIADGHDAAVALSEVLTGLGLDRVHLVGMSYGAWAVLRHELAFPGRAAGLTLLDPGGFGRLGARFWLWLAAGGLAGLTPRPVRRRLAGPVRNATLREDELMPLFPLTMAFRRRLPVPDTVADADLARITTPTLILLGERSVLYRSADLAVHLGEVMPAARVEVIPGASHDLPAHSPDVVATHLEQFLTAPGHH
ncbi:alpha/beta fold hydrolase [Actinoplanes sp. NPDC049265]|uniref:alpha/beta fold hydrolase n=1 Tax=Actinoplanes sp. NPDC049265 TaxID=3363902 RepID=UPI00371BE430